MEDKSIDSEKERDNLEDRRESYETPDEKGINDSSNDCDSKLDDGDFSDIYSEIEKSLDDNDIYKGSDRDIRIEIILQKTEVNVSDGGQVGNIAGNNRGQ